MIKRGGTIVPNAGTRTRRVELVEPESDEGGFGRGLAGVCRARLSGTVKSILAR
jgi:hypothetical protein